MKQTILITGPEIASEAEKMLIENEVRILKVEPYASSGVLEDMARKEQIDALLVRMGKIDKSVITASPRLKVIAKHGTGVNNIDIKVASDNNIPVFITLNGNYQSVAEHAVALIYCLTKNLLNLDKRLRQGVWDKSHYKGIELNNKILGLIGLGRIGRKVVELVQPLNMNIMAFDPYAKDEFPEGVREVNNLNEILTSSDYISIHCPLTEETRNLITEKELKLMKKSSFIINTARGGIINEAALIKALEQEWIAGAGLDTFSMEPPEKNNPLWGLKNVIVTPHIAGVTEESFNRMGVEAVQHILSVLNDQKANYSACINYSKIN